jgi:hypothetical protein
MLVLLVVLVVAIAIGIFAILQPRLPINPQVSSSPSLGPLNSNSPTLTISPTASSAVSSTPSLTPESTPTMTPTPSITTSPSPTTTSTLSPTPPQPSVNPTPPKAISKGENWAGYVVASDLQTPQPDVTGVSASWTVPSVATSSTDTYSAVWIGVGGRFDETLIQCGTEQDSVGGQVVYYAWYELLPQRSIAIRFMPIFPGDRIQASIKINVGSIDQWSISLTDVTSGDSFQRTFLYPSSQLSAEWIVERPTINNIFSPLADFGNVTFDSCQAYFDGSSGGILDYPSIETIMYSSVSAGSIGVKMTDVSYPVSNGTMFTVNYLSTG